MSGDQSGCVYTQHENGIHEFVLNVSSRQSFGALMARLEEIFGAHAKTDTVPVIIDWSRSGMPPLSYAFQRAREFLTRFPDGPQGRTAYISNANTLVSIAQTFLKVMKVESAGRFFQPGEREAALEWLLAYRQAADPAKPSGQQP